jgi:hypothetical protein
LVTLVNSGDRELKISIGEKPVLLERTLVPGQTHDVFLKKGVSYYLSAGDLKMPGSVIYGYVQAKNPEKWIFRRIGQNAFSEPTWQKEEVSQDDPNRDKPTHAATATQNREAKISSALKLLGQAADVRVSGPDYKTAEEVFAVAKAALDNKPLQGALKTAAKQVGAKYSNTFLRVTTTARVQAMQLRQILGEPDSVEAATETVGLGDEAHKVSVTWLKYDWCHFGVDDNAVTMVRADCKWLDSRSNLPVQPSPGGKSTEDRTAPMDTFPDGAEGFKLIDKLYSSRQSDVNLAVGRGWWAAVEEAKKLGETTMMPLQPFDLYPPNRKTVAEQLGKPERESILQYPSEVKIPPGVMLVGKPLLKVYCLWYGSFGVCFSSADNTDESTFALAYVPQKGKPTASNNAVDTTEGEQVPKKLQDPLVTTQYPVAVTSKNWPKYSGELDGAMEVRVRNPNEFGVKVGLRSAGKGKDFVVGANDTRSVQVPNGRYDIYFQYSTDPDGLYQGDSFTLNDDGVEIQIVKVVNGNYGIRKVK